MEAFGEGRGTVSLIPSILSGVTLGVGPIASVLVNRFGCRAVTIAGSVLASFGLAISAATSNVSTLYVTVGLCTGTLFGSNTANICFIIILVLRLGLRPHLPAGHRQRLDVL